MADREKVIKGWETVLSRDPLDAPWDLIDDTLALLKEQDAVKPLAKADDTFECICGAIVGWDELDASGIVQERFNYCPFCGKPIDWEGR